MSQAVARPPEERSRSTRRLWLALVCLLALIEALLLLADHGLVGSRIWRPLAWQYGGFWAGLLHGWTPNYAAQPVAMFVTYAFLHAGWQHLIGNAVTLAWLGWQLERRLDARRLAALYGISALGGALCFGLMTSSPRPMVGASGAIMGLVAVWIVADARDMAAEGKRPVTVIATALFRASVVAALNLLAWEMAGGALAWEAPLGGAAAAALALVLVPALRPARA